MRRGGPLLVILAVVGVILFLSLDRPHDDSDSASGPAGVDGETGDPFLVGRDTDVPASSDGSGVADDGDADVSGDDARWAPTRAGAEERRRVAELLSRLDRLVPLARSRDVKERTEALEGLGALVEDTEGSHDVVYAACVERALPVLFEMFADAETWKTAVSVLDAFDDVDLVAGLLALADNRQDPNVRVRALGAMSDRAMHMHEFNEMLVECASATDPAVCAAGIAALANSGESLLHLEIARRGLEHVDPRVRAAALTWYENDNLFYSGDESKSDDQRPLRLLDDPSPAVRARVRRLIQHVHPEVTFRSLLADTAHPDAAVRRAAAGDLWMWAEQMLDEHPDEAVDVVERLLGDPDDKVRALAALQAGQLSIRAARLVPRLAEMIREGGLAAIGAARALPAVDRAGAREHLDWAVEYGDDGVRPVARDVIATYYEEQR